LPIESKWGQNGDGPIFRFFLIPTFARFKIVRKIGPSPFCRSTFLGDFGLLDYWQVRDYI
jgi:hypothetical protein